MVWYDIWYTIYDMIWYDIYLLTAIGLSPGGSTYLHTKNTSNITNNYTTQITTILTNNTNNNNLLM
jgi:hypothetical protein